MLTHNTDTDTENVTYVAHLSWWLFVPKLLLCSVLAMGGIFALAREPGVVAYAFETVALAALAYAGYLVLKKKSVRAQVTPDHVLVTRKLISLHTVTLNLHRIESVDIDQSGLQRILGFGDVIIRGLGNEDVPLKGLAAPGEFKKAVLSPASSAV